MTAHLNKYPNIPFYQPIILLVVGLLLGPGYYWYLRRQGPTAIENTTVYRQSPGHDRIGKWGGRETSLGEWRSPIRVKLTSAQSPVRLVVDMTCTHTDKAIKFPEIELSLMKVDTAKSIWDQSMGLALISEQSEHKPCEARGYSESISITSSGQYELHVATPVRIDQISELRVTLVRIPRNADRAILAVGVIALLCAVIRTFQLVTEDPNGTLGRLIKAIRKLLQPVDLG